jgi:DNA-directed RNA polymerase subunit RPC12/RpoP
MKQIKMNKIFNFFICPNCGKKIDQKILFKEKKMICKCNKKIEIKNNILIFEEYP